MIERALPKGEVLTLRSSDSVKECVIEDVLGRGGSCVAYRVTYKKNNGAEVHDGVLKEFCPHYLTEDPSFVRMGAEIVVPENHKHKGRFDEDIKNFTDAYFLMNKYLHDHPNVKNSHSFQIGFYNGNNTAYTLESYKPGVTLDKAGNTDLQTLLKILYNVTCVIEAYHNAGILHLDIKPQNIFVITNVNGDVTENVSFFDNDSFTLISNLEEAKKGIRNIRLPRPGIYVVPELGDEKNTGELRKVGVRSDVYEIGATLYLSLFGDFPRFSGFDYDDEIDMDSAELLEAAPPALKHELEELLRKTVSRSCRDRYGNTEQLKKQLERLIEMADKRSQYVMDLPRWQPSRYFLSRTDEIRKIEDRLDKDGYVFVRGDVGVGKSELVKYFAGVNGGKYHTVQFCRFNGRLKDVVLGLSIEGFNESEYHDTEAIIRAKNKILRRSSPGTLIVVDNFNKRYDGYLSSFLPAQSDSFKVIFTTRCLYSDSSHDYSENTVEVQRLSHSDCVSLFCSVADLPEDDPYAGKIVSEVGRNTLVLVLVAKAIARSGESSRAIYKKITDTGIDDIDTEIPYEYDFDSEDDDAYKKIIGHLKAIYNLGVIQDDIKIILKNMTLVSEDGIQIDEFIKACGCRSITEAKVSDAIEFGWLELKDGDVTVSSVLADMIAKDDSIPKTDSYYALADHLVKKYSPGTETHITKIMSQIVGAKRLEKRFASEEPWRYIQIKIMLGRLYLEVYDRYSAKMYLNSADELASSEEYKNIPQVRALLPLIYYYKGQVEKRFGTTSSAVKEFIKAENSAKNTEPELENTEICVKSKMEIAGCYLEDFNYNDAYIKYDDLMYYILLRDLTGYVYDAARVMHDICRELGYRNEMTTYSNLMALHRGSAVGVCGETVIARKVSRLEVSGEYFSGTEEYERFLMEKAEELGEDSPEYKYLAQKRWMCYILNGDADLGKRIVSETVDFIEQTYGRSSMEFARQLVAMARLYPRISEIDYSIECAYRAVHICASSGESNSFVVFLAWLEMAKCYYMQGKLEEAKNALSHITLSSHCESAVLAEKVMSVGMCLLELGEYDAVLSMCGDIDYRGDIDTFEKDYAKLVCAAADLYRGYYEDSAGKCREAVSEICAMHDCPAKDEWLMLGRCILASSFFKGGDTETALAVLDEAVSCVKAGEQGLFMARAYMDRGTYLAKTGRYAESDADFEKCTAILEKNKIPREGYVMLYNSIVSSCLCRGDLDKAEEYLGIIEGIRPSVTQPELYSDALICNNIGLAALYRDDIMLAGRMFSRAQKTYKKLGATHSADYIAALRNLAAAYEKRGDTGEAENIRSYIERVQKSR